MNEKKTGKRMRMARSLLLAAALFLASALALAAGDDCGYLPDEMYRRLDPAEVGCVSVWQRDERLREDGRCVALSVEKQGDDALLVTMTNTCAEAVTFHEARLPWRYGTSGLRLVMEPLDGTERTVQARAPLTSSLKYVVLGPRRSASAVMHLDNYFQNLDAALRRGDIMLYWMFRFDPAAPEQEGGILFRAVEDEWMEEEQAAAPPDATGTRAPEPDAAGEEETNSPEAVNTIQE